MPVRHLYVLLGKMSAQVFSPFYGLGSLFLFWGFFVCLFVCFFDAELDDLLMYFRYQALVSHSICKYFVPFCRLFFNCAKVYTFFF